MSNFKISIIFITILIISGCVSKYPETVQVDNSQNKIQKCPDVYKVVKGDTIFSLSIKCGFDYREVAAVNNIKKPYKISEGEEIRFDLLRNKSQNADSAKTSDSTDVEIKILDDENEIVTQDKKKVTQEEIGKPVQINEPIATRETYNPKSVKKTKEIIAKNTESLSNRFVWPTEGEVLENFNPDEGKKGIAIQGTLGQEIKSIAKGRVIYAGEDLKGYGKLVIIKHDDDILSVYGHNRELLVTEGQQINAGDIISTMGQTDKEQVMLHFEIRKKGLSVNPMDYFKTKS